MELKTCAFCGSSKLNISVKTASNGNSRHICIYCVKCRATGPRVLFKPIERKWYNEDNIPDEVKLKAVDLWNKRS